MEEEPNTGQRQQVDGDQFSKSPVQLFKAAKPIEEQKSDECPDSLPQAKAPLWVSPAQQSVEIS